jgi:hypothetical protein
VKQVADEVLLDRQVALVDVDDEGQRVHVLERRPLGRVADHAVRAVGEPADPLERAALRHLLDRKVELVAGHELDRVRGGQRVLGMHRDVGADEADPEAGVLRAERLGHLHVVGEGRRARVEHRQLVPARERQHVLEPEAGGWGVDQARARDQRRGLREPGRIPEGADLAARLVARAGAAVEPLVRGRVEEERLEVARGRRVRQARPPRGSSGTRAPRPCR